MNNEVCRGSDLTSLKSHRFEQLFIPFGQYKHKWAFLTIVFIENKVLKFVIESFIIEKLEDHRICKYYHILILLHITVKLLYVLKIIICKKTRQKQHSELIIINTNEEQWHVIQSIIVMPIICLYVNIFGETDFPILEKWSQALHGAFKRYNFLSARVY